MTLEKRFPPDIRVVKEARALLTAGHEVHLLACAEAEKGSLNPADENLDGVLVRRIPPAYWQLSAGALRCNTLRRLLTSEDRYWFPHVMRFAQDFNLNALHVHDLPLVGTAVLVGVRFGIPVIADLHENMPAAYRIRPTEFHGIRKLREAIFYNYYLWRRNERRTLPLCSGILVVVQEAAERLYDYGIEGGKIILVSNTEDETTFPLHSPDPGIEKQYQGMFVASYIGGFGPDRGLDTAIRAIPIAAREIPNLHLVIVGGQRDRQINPLIRLIFQLGVEKRVEVWGWQPSKRVGDFIATSDACLVPHHNSEHRQTSVPHKLFQYMISGKPVIVSDVRPLRRIVEEVQSGLVFQAGDPSSLAQSLISLHRDPELRKHLGRNGQQAATGRYSWRHDAERLIELYRNLGR
jgi:glycosyltransferase involved in cell wall biosynthesis